MTVAAVKVRMVPMVSEPAGCPGRSAQRPSQIPMTPMAATAAMTQSNRVDAATLITLNGWRTELDQDREYAGWEGVRPV
jgi:hypothetical protein